MSVTDARGTTPAEHGSAAGAAAAGAARGAHRPAQLGRRAGAYLIDTAVAMLLLFAAAAAFAGISVATEGGFPLWAAGAAAWLVLAAWSVVYTLMQAGAGSLGMRALGLRLVRVPGGARLGFGAALGRNVVWWLGGLIVVGMFSPLFDRSVWHRGWHDRASGAVMTDIAGRGPLLAFPGAVADDADGATDRAEAADARSRASEASLPTVLPAAPILPSGEDTDLAGWTPGRAEPQDVRPSATGVISFVPGITDPALYDAPAHEREAGPPVVDAPAPPAVVPAGSVSEASVSDPAPAPDVDDPLEQTRLSTGERPVARLVWDDGARQAVYGRTLFGRNPTPETGAMVSPVRDETLSLSKTHFELVPGDDRSLWVIDRHSTNGVVVRRGTQRQAVVAGERTRVRMGDVLEFGDRHMTIEVAS